MNKIMALLKKQKFISFIIISTILSFIFLVIPFSCHAATQLKKTVKPAGQGGDYTSLEECMNANEQDLVTNDLYFDVEIDGDWSGGADTTAVTIHNYTTDATHYINIYTTSAARHRGYYDTDRYRIEVGADAFKSIDINNLKLTGLVIKNGEEGSGVNEAFKFLDTAEPDVANLEVNSCIFLTPFEGDAVSAQGLNITFRNIIAISSSDYGFYIKGTNVIMQNCIAYGDWGGFSIEAVTLEVTNCYAVTSGTSLGSLGYELTAEEVEIVTSRSNDGSETITEIEYEFQIPGGSSFPQNHTFVNGNIFRGTVIIMETEEMAFVYDDIEGNLLDSVTEEIVGTIDYETGEWSATFGPTPYGDIYAFYSYGATPVAYSTSSGSYFTNITPGSENFHIGALSELKDIGTDLSADFTIDIDGDTRPTGANTWDIGADEYVILNSSPEAPSSLGPPSLVDGSLGDDNTPTLQFTQTDPDAADTVKYQIQIATSSDFSTQAIDYTSVLMATGTASFTVGQALGDGIYTVGSESQTLSDDSYYWRVMSTDNSDATSSWATANSGDIAFKVNTVAPTVSISSSYPSYSGPSNQTKPLTQSQVPLVTLPSNYSFNTNLSYNQTNLSVGYLQIFLKFQGKDVYPEGLISGWFGPLTRQAVIRFQEKYSQDILAPWGLTKGTGFVGKTTQAKIKEILGK